MVVLALQCTKEHRGRLHQEVVGKALAFVIALRSGTGLERQCLLPNNHRKKNGERLEQVLARLRS